MKRTIDADRLIEVIRDLANEGAPAHTVKDVNRASRARSEPPPAPPEVMAAPGPLGRSFDKDTLEWLYVQFKNRMIDDLRLDPVLLQLVEQRQEIVIEIAPQVVTLDGTTLRGRVARLIANGFFDQAQRTGTARAELQRTGTLPNSGQLSTTLGEFVQQGFLTREGDRYRKAPDIRISEKRLTS